MWIDLSQEWMLRVKETKWQIVKTMKLTRNFFKCSDCIVQHFVERSCKIMMFTCVLIMQSRFLTFEQSAKVIVLM